MFGFLNALSRNSDPITSDEAAEQVHVEHVEGVIVRHLKFWPRGVATWSMVWRSAANLWRFGNPGLTDEWPSTQLA